MNGLPMRTLRIMVKDMQATLNRIPLLLGVYLFYFLIVWFPLRELTSRILAMGPGVRLFPSLFMVQTALTITFMLLPLLIYRESLTGRHEVYFAYGFSVMDIVMAKSLLITLLSLVPAMLFMVVAFPNLVCRSLFSPLNLVALFMSVSGLIGLTVFLTWFSRLGRLAVALIVPLMVLGFRHSRSIMLWALGSPFMAQWAMMAGGALIWLLLFAVQQWGHRENLLIRR